MEFVHILPKKNCQFKVESIKESSINLLTQAVPTHLKWKLAYQCHYSHTLHIYVDIFGGIQHPYYENPNQQAALVPSEDYHHYKIVRRI
jgi:thymidylate synthase